MRSVDNKIENTLFVHFQRYHKFVFEKVIFEDFKFLVLFYNYIIILQTFFNILRNNTILKLRTYVNNFI
jgi:hypothetical protein